jgi:hypothetical protein
MSILGGEGAFAAFLRPIHTHQCGSDIGAVRIHLVTIENPSLVDLTRGFIKDASLTAAAYPQNYNLTAFHS